MLAVAASVTATAAWGQTTDTATANDQATTATAERSGLTTQSPIMAFHYSDEAFESRWNKEAEIYREADISEAKIKKLRDLKYQQWQARRSGEKIDYAALVREASRVLTPSEVKKMREIRDRKIEDQLNDNIGKFNRRTTGGRAVMMNPGTSYSTTGTVENKAKK